MKKQLFILFVFLMPHFACLNGYEVSGDGERHDMNNIYEIKPYEVSKSQKEHYTYILKYDFNNLSKYTLYFCLPGSLKPLDIHIGKWFRDFK